MGNFNIDTTSRSWMVTVQITNMEKAGLTKEEYTNPELLASFLINRWEESGKGRKAGVAVCVSEHGLYHAHLACYCNTTTLKKVANIFWGSHVEQQLGGKKELASYLLKDGKYAEKGEQVLCSKGIENIKNSQGSRNDLQEIEKMLEDGCTPSEIFE